MIKNYLENLPRQIERNEQNEATTTTKKSNKESNRMKKQQIKISNREGKGGGLKNYLKWNLFWTKISV